MTAPTTQVRDIPVGPGLCQVSERGIPCLEPGASAWDAGCAHEHVTTGISICAGHEWRMTGRPWNCVTCRDGERPHECPVTPVRRPA
jgi:hypothetical protein